MLRRAFCRYWEGGGGVVGDEPSDLVMLPGRVIGGGLTREVGDFSLSLDTDACLFFLPRKPLLFLMGLVRVWCLRAGKKERSCCRSGVEIDRARLGLRWMLDELLSPSEVLGGGPVDES